MMMDHLQIDAYIRSGAETLPNGDPVPSEAARPHCTGIRDDGTTRYDYTNFGYVLAYIMRDGDAVCGRCVSTWGDDVVAVFAPEEDPLYCAHCGDVIGDETRIAIDHCTDGACAYILRTVDGTRTFRLGWTLDLVRVAEAFGYRGICECGATDGTVDCAHRDRDDMYTEAIEHLDRVADDAYTACDPGYFGPE